MAKINIDGKEYDADSLSEEVKGQLMSLQFVDTELKRLQMQLASLQTARMAYANALKQALDKGPASPPHSTFAGDTIKFS